MKKKIPLTLLVFASSLNMFLLLLSVVKIQTHTWFVSTHGTVFYLALIFGVHYRQQV